MCALASGRTYSQTLSEIVEMAASRGADDSSAAEPAPVSTDALTRKYRQRMARAAGRQMPGDETS
jgi:hypothetical protein